MIKIIYFRFYFFPLFKGEVVDQTMIIPELLEVVRRIKPIYNKYVIDEMVLQQNKTVLRLPPYHCELNPIELA